MNRSRDWLEQARANLRHAENSLAAEDFAWACFAAHQAAEAALKGLHLRYGQVAWGHSLVDLAASLPETAEFPSDLHDKVKILDKFYIPTRYPDAHPAGSAARHYTQREAWEAIRIAEEVVAHCEGTGLEDGS